MDLMGGDNSPEELFKGVLQVLPSLESSDVFVVIGIPEVIDKLQATYQGSTSIPKFPQLEFAKASEVVTMEDSPLRAVLRKERSSMLQGLRRLSREDFDGFITVGNTGALFAGSAIFLPRFPNISRPALLALLPSLKGKVAALDIGANLVCKSKHLINFAQMGIAFQQCREGIERPRVGLLNIGSEAKKGREEVRKTYEMLQENCFGGHFVGNVEGRDVFKGEVDVLVTDGFTGNVFLKTTEGVTSFMLELYRQHLPKNSQQELLSSIDYSHYPGAIICGVEGLVVKCHGNSDAKAFASGIKGAIDMIRSKFIRSISEKLALQY
ncbi:MAG: phosphate acyltransferase PlsX [Chlamydiota bacterium]